MCIARRDGRVDLAESKGSLGRLSRRQGGLEGRSEGTCVGGCRRNEGRLRMMKQRRAEVDHRLKKRRGRLQGDVSDSEQRLLGAVTAAPLQATTGSVKKCRRAQAESALWAAKGGAKGSSVKGRGILGWVSDVSTASRVRMQVSLSGWSRPASRSQ